MNKNEMGRRRFEIVEDQGEYLVVDHSRSGVDDLELQDITVDVFTVRDYAEQYLQLLERRERDRLNRLELAARIASQVAGFAIYASNNYTCRREQHMLVETYPATQAGTAMALDRAYIEAVERRGYSGMGAGAVAEMLMTDDDEDEGGEAIENMSDPVISALPVGNIAAVRDFIRHWNNTSVWDGHNHVIPSTKFARGLLDKVRGRREEGDNV